jgi:hypothetical protein
MGDRSSNKSLMDHALKVLNHMMLAPEELRDELYCQLCKQTHQNPDSTSTERGWQLMMMGLAIFPPSSDLMPHLMAYCVANLKNENPNVAIFAEICLHRSLSLYLIFPSLVAELFPLESRPSLVLVHDENFQQRLNWKL